MATRRRRVHVRAHHRRSGTGRRRNPKILGLSGKTLLVIGAAGAGLYMLSKRKKALPAAARGDGEAHGSALGSGRAAPGASFGSGLRSPGFGGRPFYARGDDFGTSGGSF